MSYNDLRTGRISCPGREYFVTAVLAGRHPLFQEFHLARAFIRELAHAEQTGQVQWLAWVVMPDHFHGLLRLESGELSQVMRGIKGRSARQINRLLENPYPLWQPGFYDRALRVEEDRVAIARYIAANPLRAGLASNLRDYPHWDSVWL